MVRFDTKKELLYHPGPLDKSKRDLGARNREVAGRGGRVPDPGRGGVIRGLPREIEH